MISWGTLTTAVYLARSKWPNHKRINASWEAGLIGVS